MTAIARTGCLCDRLPAGSICVACAYARGFPAKLYLANRAYDDSPSQVDRWCACGRRVMTDWDRCYACRAKAVSR